MKKNKLFLGNLSYSLTEEDIRELMEPFGEIESLRLFADKGFAFIEFTTEESAEKALTELSDQEVKGRPIKIDFARPREDKPRQGQF